jgi:hypothetical protein
LNKSFSERALFHGFHHLDLFHPFSDDRRPEACFGAPIFGATRGEQKEAVLNRLRGDGTTS